MAISYRAVVKETLRALFEPRRAGPLLLVGLALVTSETVFSKSYRAGGVALLLALATTALAPCGFRVWVEPSRGWDRLWGTLAYVAMGIALLLVFGVGLAHLLQLKTLFLLRPTSLLICLSLFIVAGWGAGRDISMELRLRREEARSEALAEEAERAQLLAIRNNLDPHFLFNTLNAIAEWCRQDGAVAERALVQLSALLRAIFDGVREPAWPLERELALVRDLFEMHRLRDPSRLEIIWDVPAVPVVQLPSLLLLPLAENAMTHGPAAGHPGVVRLSLRQLERRLEIELINPGAFRGPRAGGSGLASLRKRLSMAYGSSATLQVEGVGETTRAKLELPCG
ncbi:MAG TPA: histidine kinase [Myxococcales bacterium]|jgi:signal transduction histidine kinase|nr:histidine kinase [Myxococcales bacterium]